MMYNNTHKSTILAYKVPLSVPLFKKNFTQKGAIYVAEIKSNKYPGVYYRPLENGDRSYFLRLKIDGSTKRFPIGKKSEGITEAFCNQQRLKIMNAARFGESEALKLQKVKPQEPTFAELFEWYISKRELKDSTAKHLQILRTVPFWNSKKITRDDVQSYIDELIKTKRPATVTLRYRQLRAIFRYAIQREKYKYQNPTHGIDLPKSTGPRKRYLTAQEVQTLLGAFMGKPRHYLFIKLLLCTGARLGTVLSIHRDDIQPDGTVTLYNHKADRKYTGFLDEECMRLIDGKRGYILALPGKEDKVPSQQSLQYPVLKVMDELFNTPDTPKEERAVLHSIRHSVAVKMIEDGVPLEVVSGVLSHSSLAITHEHYAHISPKVIRRATENLWS